MGVGATAGPNGPSLNAGQAIVCPLFKQIQYRGRSGIAGADFIATTMRRAAGRVVYDRTTKGVIDMAVAFTDREKQDIAKVLVDTAEELFATQGLKKTSLEELVGPARIAKGSFYAFFDSKEALYLEVMLRRAPQIATRFTGMLERPVDEEGLVALMHAIADVLVADPFYRRLLSHPDELDTVTRRVGREQIARISPHLLTPLVEYLAAGQ